MTNELKPVALEWRKRFFEGGYIWSEWEPLRPPYMDARELSEVDPQNYELRELYFIPYTHRVVSVEMLEEMVTACNYAGWKIKAEELRAIITRKTGRACSDR